MLTEQQCKLIEIGLTKDVEPRKAAAYLCLHMGLMLAEVAALRWQDIDLDAGTVELRNIIGRPEGGDNTAPVTFMPYDAPRTLPMPPHVKRYLTENSDLYKNSQCFILTGGAEIPAFYPMQNILSSICNKYKVARNLSAMDLRNAFIRRCIQSGMDLFSLCTYIGIRQPNVIVKRFSEYFVSRLDSINVLEKYSADYVPPESKVEPESMGPKGMNLLILGAGSQGPVVKEIAEAIGVFRKIDFLDDDPDNKLAIGPLSDLEKLTSRYPMAIPSFGNSLLRMKYMDILESLGYVVPGLTHPSATVSPNANVERSVVIEARSVVSAGAELKRGVLVSSASVVGVGAHIGQFAHIGSSVTVEKNAVVPAYTRVPSGAVIRAEQE